LLHKCQQEEGFIDRHVFNCVLWYVSHGCRLFQLFK